MLIVQDLHYSYPGDLFRLHVPTLQIDTGVSAALIGRSGCGKSTLLHLLAGILQPVSGTITIGDVSPTSLSDSARRRFRLENVGLIFQDFQLIDYLSVLDNVLLPCRLNPAVVLTSGIRDRAEWLLSLAGLSESLRKMVSQLSQGERQRVAICRSLLLKPKLLLADEPTGNLDPETADQILQLLLTQSRENRATLLMVTHDHSLLGRFDTVISSADSLISCRSGADVSPAGGSVLN